MVTWLQFQEWPERPETSLRYELHDGEVVEIPIPRPWEVMLAERIDRRLEALAAGRGVVTSYWPYRPAPNLQYWVAGIAYVPRADWDSMPNDDWPVYAPPLIVEVLSPSNTPVKVKSQLITAMSAGTEEFWVVNRDKQAVEVSSLDGVNVYGRGDAIPLPVLGGSLPVDEIFA